MKEVEELTRRKESQGEGTAHAKAPNLKKSAKNSELEQRERSKRGWPFPRLPTLEGKAGRDSVMWSFIHSPSWSFNSSCLYSLPDPTGSWRQGNKQKNM